MPTEAGSNGRKGDLWIRCEIEKVRFFSHPLKPQHGGSFLTFFLSFFGAFQLDEDWARKIDLIALAKLLPPKRADPTPLPEKVTKASYVVDEQPPVAGARHEDEYGDYSEEEGGDYDDDDDSTFPPSGPPTLRNVGKTN